MSATPDAPGGIVIHKAVTVNRPCDEVYRFWRDFENLPRFMKHLKSVRTADERRSRWVAAAPLGSGIAWDAEIAEEQENRLIAWRSVGDTAVPNAGKVVFEQAPGDRGTEVRVRLSYAPPAGIVGSTVARLLGEEPDKQVADDLRRFKAVLEAGEIPTIDGQPSGPRPRATAGVAAHLEK